MKYDAAVQHDEGESVWCHKWLGSVKRKNTKIVIIPNCSLLGKTAILTREFDFQFISNNFKLALKLNLHGAYIPSFNKSFYHLNFSLKKNFIIIGSAHNLREIRIKEKQKVDAIFLSSIFKKNNNYLGLFKFLNLCSLSKKTVIALGGISLKNKKILNMFNLWGFAGISYFK